MTHKTLTLPAKKQEFTVLQAQTYADLERQLNTLATKNRVAIISSHIDSGVFFVTLTLYPLK